MQALIPAALHPSVISILIFHPLALISFLFLADRPSTSFSYCLLVLLCALISTIGNYLPLYQRVFRSRYMQSIYSSLPCTVSYLSKNKSDLSQLSLPISKLALIYYFFSFQMFNPLFFYNSQLLQITHYTCE